MLKKELVFAEFLWDIPPSSWKMNYHVLQINSSPRPNNCLDLLFSSSRRTEFLGYGHKNFMLPLPKKKTIHGLRKIITVYKNNEIKFSFQFFVPTIKFCFFFRFSQHLAAKIYN